jgi:hypothetical protein
MNQVCLLQEHPSAEGSALEAIMAAYEGNPAARTGAALALKACSPHWTAPRVQMALDFLLGSGLADPDDGVRSHMVEAGTRH